MRVELFLVPERVLIVPPAFSHVAQTGTKAPALEHSCAWFIKTPECRRMLGCCRELFADRTRGPPFDLHVDVGIRPGQPQVVCKVELALEFESARAQIVGHLHLAKPAKDRWIHGLEDHAVALVDIKDGCGD